MPPSRLCVGEASINDTRLSSEVEFLTWYIFTLGHLFLKISNVVVKLYLDDDPYVVCIGAYSL